MPSLLPTEIESRNRVSRVLSLLRWKPFETSTAEGLARERHRRILFSTIASGLAKGVSILAGLIIVPMTLHYLGEERYAVWAMISSLFLAMNSADLGIGTGLLNLVAAASGKDDRRLIKKYVSSGFFMLLTIGVGIAAVMLTASHFVPMAKVFNVTSDLARGEAGRAVGVVALIFGLGMPLLVALRFQEGLQEGFNSYLGQMAGNILALGFAIIVVKLQLGLPWLVLSLLGGPLVANFGVFAAQFFFYKSWACPSWSDFDLPTSQALLRTGLIFFVLNVLTLVAWQTLDPFIISHVLGPTEGVRQVAAYSVVQRLSQIGFLYFALTQSLWPAYAEAISRGDFNWVRKTIVRSIRLSVIWGVLSGVVLFVCGGRLIHWWIGSAVAASDVRGLLLSFAVFMLVWSLVSALSVIIIGSQLLKECLVFLSITAVLSFVSKLVLCRSMGASGVVWASIFGYSVAFLLPAMWLIRRTYWSFSPDKRRDS
jgi:O-antigen/teichoic acid export membrane protein